MARAVRLHQISSALKPNALARTIPARGASCPLASGRVAVLGEWLPGFILLVRHANVIAAGRMQSSRRWPVLRGCVSVGGLPVLRGILGPRQSSARWH